MNFLKSVTSHALGPLPLSQTDTPSRTTSPSSVTYFMDGPYTRRSVHRPMHAAQLIMEHQIGLPWAKQREHAISDDSDLICLFSGSRVHMKLYNIMYIS